MSTPPPQTHAFLKWRFLADFKKYTHPPPPQVTTCLHTVAKVVESAEKCQNPESWQVLNVPERYVVTLLGRHNMKAKVAHYVLFPDIHIYSHAPSSIFSSFLITYWLHGEHEEIENLRRS